MPAAYVPGPNGPIVLSAASAGAGGTVFQVTMTGHENGWEGYTMVLAVAGSALAAATGTQVRVTVDFFTITSDDTVSIYMAKQGAGDPYDFAGTPTHITFAGVDIVGTGSGSETFVSDWCNLPEAYDEAATYCIAVQSVGTGINAQTAAASGVNQYYKNAADGATVNKSGYTTYTTNQTQFISKIEVQ